MELYYKKSNVNDIIELFVLFKLECTNKEYLIESSYFQQFVNARFSVRVSLDILDTYNSLKVEYAKESFSKEKRLVMMNEKLESINKELTKKQKIEIYVALMNMAIDNVSIEETENKEEVVRLHNILKEGLKLHDNDIQNIFLFIKNNVENKQLSNEILVVGNFKNINIRSYKTLHAEGLKGKIFLLYLELTSSFLMRYSGKR